jgi:2'-5' RNA ligase
MKVSWTKADMAHITVLFIGEVEGAQVAKIEEILEKIAPAAAPFSFMLSGHEVFAPNGVVVVRAKASSDSGDALRSELQAALKKEGIAFDEKDWKPHATLARNKQETDLRGLDAVEVKPVSWPVNEVLLMESIADRAGHEHRVLRKFSFGE